MHKERGEKSMEHKVQVELIIKNEKHAFYLIGPLQNCPFAN
jgi:hypothetical protein